MFQTRLSRTRLMLLAICGTAACFAQGSNTATVNGVTIRFDWRAVPDGSGPSKSGGGVLVKDNIVKRHVGIFDTHKYFGYDLTATPEGNGRYMLSISASTLSPATMSQLFPGEWTMVQMPRRPINQLVSVGDVITLDLLENAANGHKIVDRIEVIDGAGIRNTASAKPPRDFALDDVEWTFDSPKLLVNGSVVESSGSTIAGSPSWVYLKNHGRFVFSLRPRTELGFVKAGQLRGTDLEWTMGGTRYAVRARRNIIASEARTYNLYVFHSASYRASSKDANFEFGTGGTIESLVRR
jgi:hypothetical protein